MKYKVITICGSSKFRKDMINIQWGLAMDGHVVLMPNIRPTEPVYSSLNAKGKLLFDGLHRQKIDMSDEIFVVNIDGYIGEGVQSEIEYATKQGKPIRYLHELIK